MTPIQGCMQKGPSEIAVVQISRTEYIMKFYRNMVDQIPQKHILWPFTAFYDLPFEIRTRAVRHVIMEYTRELLLEQKLKLHQVGDPIKRHTNLFKFGYIYHMCRTHHFRSKGQCATEIQLLNTPHDRRCCHQAMTPLWCSSINTLWFPQKKLPRARSRPGVGATAILCHQDYVVKWQRRRRLLSIQALICF